MKGKKRAFEYKKYPKFMDFDYNDILELDYDGASEDQIASEIGLSKKHLEELKNKILQDY